MSDTTRRIAGLAWMFVDGVQYPVVGNPGYGLSRVERETLAGMDGIHGYSEKPRPGFIRAQCRDVAGASIAAFEDMTNVSVTLQLANGKQVTGVGMWLTSAVEVNSADATYDLRFDGDDVREG